MNAADPTAGVATNPEETAKAILDAASRRFLHYGYGKTTMSEIAADCNMSPGNVYRFFPSKLDIAEAFVRRLRTDHLEELRRAVSEPGLSTPERLRTYFRTKQRLVFDRFHERPKAYELSQEILKERASFASEWEAAEAAIISDILARGADTGDLVLRDRARSARLLQTIFFRFTSSVIYFEGDYAALAAELDEVMDLVLDGFAWRHSGFVRDA
ncbi:MAG: TetR/AcrR family transcriptional regulator [Parvularculaceae bacterium]|nr:TetR/AcrR family transcriptional regulator [Parvularculaceae bacterium]